MDIQPIKTDADHEQALREIERFWNAEPGTPDGDKLDVLVTLVEAYENEHRPIEPLNPIEAIEGEGEARDGEEPAERSKCEVPQKPQTVVNIGK